MFGFSVLSFTGHGHSVPALVDQQFLQTYPDVKSELSSLLPNCPQQLSTVCKWQRYSIWSKDQAPQVPTLE